MAAPDLSTTIEGAIGGLPLVKNAGLNTLAAVNFSGWQVTTGGLASGSTTGPTGSYANVNLQQTIIAGSTGSAAILATAGASGGGPATPNAQGWAVIYVNGVKCWIPVWQ